MSKRAVEFWTTWSWGNRPIWCSSHRTQRSAIREALRCERAGGAPHDIVQVVNRGKAQALKRKGRP